MFFMYQKPEYTFEDVIKYMWPNHVIFPFSNNQICLCMSLCFPSPARQYSFAGFLIKFGANSLKSFCSESDNNWILQRPAKK